MPYPLCILCAGRGSRLGNLTSNFSKALLPLKRKAIISHIIEKVNLNSEIILALGYDKEKIKEYCLACHPERIFKFVDVDVWEGSGSGPGRSLLCCKSYLQEPFYLTTVDCIVEEELPPLDSDWLGVYPVSDPSQFSTVEIKEDNIITMKNKDTNGFNTAWIGLAGIKSYELFWSELDKPQVSEVEVAAAFYEPTKYQCLKPINFTWHDTGSEETYQTTKTKLEGNSFNFSKTNEITYFDNGYVIKVSTANRINRATYLKNVIPDISFIGNHTVAYHYVHGEILYLNMNIDLLRKLLNWCKESIWSNRHVENFSYSCKKFYHDKTMSRINTYLSIHKDGKQIINNKEYKSIDYYLSKFPWDRLYDGIPVTFHGDLQPANIIWNGSRFFLIDWRESFADQEIYGDLYYDLAKLSASIPTPWHYMADGLFDISVKNNVVNYKYKHLDNEQELSSYLETWITANGYNYDVVKLLIPLIYLNMAPLHVSQFGEMLFAHAKTLLHELIL